MRTAASRSLATCARGRQPVEARHLDVEDHEVRPEVAHQLDGFVATAGFADDVVALLLEELLEVETDDRLVLGDDHTGGAGGLSGHGRSRGQRADSSAEMRSSSTSCSRSSSRTVVRRDSACRPWASA